MHFRLHASWQFGGSIGNFVALNPLPASGFVPGVADDFERPVRCLGLDGDEPAVRDLDICRE